MSFKIRRDPLDILWALVVKTRDGFRCRRCQSQVRGKGMQAAHIFGRGRHSVRWDPEDGVTLCTGCHSFFHSNPQAFHAWVKANILDAERYERLRVLANTSMTMRVDKTLIRLQLRARLNEYTLQRR